MASASENFRFMPSDSSASRLPGSGAKRSSRDFLATTRFRTVDLLCYNAMSGGKYEETGMTYTAFRKPTPEEMASYREIFRFS